jgi:hypothetical protein
MRRVELPESDGNDPRKAVVISYVPLLAGESGRVVSVGEEEFTRLMAEADRCPSGLADGCLWVADNGGVFPVFLMPQAHAIADHLLGWAENRPGDWFAVCFAQRQGRYVVTLFPRLAWSVERFEAAYFVRHGELSNAEGYELLCRPLAFVSGPNHTFGRVKKLIADPCSLGLLEPDDFDTATPTSLNLDCIRRVGPFPVCWNEKPFNYSIKPIIEKLGHDASEPEAN